MHYSLKILIRSGRIRSCGNIATVDKQEAHRIEPGGMWVFVPNFKIIISLENRAAFYFRGITLLPPNNDKMENVLLPAILPAAGPINQGTGRLGKSLQTQIVRWAYEHPSMGFLRTWFQQFQPRFNPPARPPTQFSRAVPGLSAGRRLRKGRLALGTNAQRDDYRRGRRCCGTRAPSSNFRLGLAWGISS